MADNVHVYYQACLLVEAHVRVAFWDKAPSWIGTDPADLERPYAEFSVPAEDGLQLSLNPEHARSLAAALLRAADAAIRGDAPSDTHQTRTATLHPRTEPSVVALAWDRRRS